MSSRKDILDDLRDALDDWIPKRKQTMKAMEELADDINTHGKVDNGVKIAGAAVGAAAGVAGGVLGLIAIFATGGLATPFVVAGAVAGVAGVGGAVTAGGAEIHKAFKLPSLLNEAQDKLEGETDEYKTVIDNLARLHKTVEKKKVDVPTQWMAGVSAPSNSAQAVLGLLSAYSSLQIQIAEAASIAAAEAAATVVAKQTALQIVGPTAEAVIEAATKAAKDAGTKTAVGAVLKGFSETTTEAIAKAAGKAAAEAAMDAGKTATREAIQAAAEAAARPAARTAARAIIKEAAKEVGAVTGEVAAKTTGKSAGAIIGKTLGRAIPFLNFGFAIWDTVEGGKAAYDIASGTSEEQTLREKIKQLKQEANKIVVRIYNFYADKEKPQLPHYAIPFPDVKLEDE